jgi:predicted nucleic acid-binding protein
MSAIARAYFDTAFVVKCYVPEPGSDAVRAFASRVDELVTSELTRAEFAAAVHRHRREKAFTRKDADAVLAQFDADCAAHVWTLVPVSSTVLNDVWSRFATLPPSVSLRAADAMHCASAALTGFDVIYSNDRQLLAGAKHFGLGGVDLTAV